jgi:hypothetical protein
MALAELREGTVWGKRDAIYRGKSGTKRKKEKKERSRSKELVRNL